MVTAAEAALHFYQRLAEQLLPEPALAAQGVLMLCEKDWSLPDQDIHGVAKALVRRIQPGLIEPFFTIGWKNLGNACISGLVLDIRRDSDPLPDWAQSTIADAAPGVVVVSNEAVIGLGLLQLAFWRNQAVFDAVPLALKSVEELCHVKFDVVAPRRFMGGGLLEAMEVGSLFAPAQQKRDLNKHDLLSLCRTLCSTWIYRGRQVTAEHAAKWAEQFREAGLIKEAVDVLKYMNSDGFLSKNYIIDCIRSQYFLVAEKHKLVHGVFVQEIQKSEQLLLYDLRFISGRVVKFSDAIELYKATSTIVCFDDVVGSGGTFVDALFGGRGGVHPETVSEWLVNGNNRIAIVCAIAGEEGKNRIESHELACGRVELFAQRLLRNGEATFHEKSKIFSAGSDEGKFLEFCQAVGVDLYPRAPLGFGDSRWCIVTEYNAPNNSLPVIFAGGNSKRQWVPLFERVEPI